jgi:alkyl hydroperoxide reductase subunit D
MDLSSLRERLPEYAKDLKLNLGSVLTSSSLTDVEAWGSGLAAALVSKHPLVIQTMRDECQSRLTPEQVQGVAAAAAIMSMNNVWYKLVQLHDDNEVKQIPARLRMQVIGVHGGVNKRLFEAWSLAVSIVNSCPFCITSHTQVLRKEGMTAQNIADIGRIASVIKAVSDILTFDAYLQTPIAAEAA